MMRKVAGFAWFIATFVGLPFLGWKLSILIVENPPLVAPFLLASPFYALAIAGQIMSRPFTKEWGKDKVPIEADEIDPYLERYADILGRYAGRVAYAGHDLVGPILVWDSWILVDRKTWRELGRAGREFMLIRAMRPRHSWLYAVLWMGVYLAAYILTCINLWFVVILHITGATAFALLAMRRMYSHEHKRDREALKVTKSYKGALEYITSLEYNDSAKEARLAALKQSAVELGFA